MATRAEVQEAFRKLEADLVALSKAEKDMLQAFEIYNASKAVKRLAKRI